MAMQKFTAKIYKIGINPVVDPPEKILRAIFTQAGKEKSPIPVHGLLNGAEFIQTLVKYQGTWRLYINGPMLRNSSLAVGDKADVAIAFDERPRIVLMMKEFSAALKRDNIAGDEYQKLSPSRRKEILRYLGSLKSQESLEKNVIRIVKHLKGEATDAQHGLMRKKERLSRRS